MKQHNDVNKVLQDCQALVKEQREKLEQQANAIFKLQKINDQLQTDNDLKEYELNLLKSKLKATYVEKLNDRPNQE
tara:strand:+ start:1916 stop:2143 length:228 start_codon:yes stop_codon:yes gene_type:complete